MSVAPEEPGRFPEAIELVKPTMLGRAVPDTLGAMML